MCDVGKRGVARAFYTLPSIPDNLVLTLETQMIDTERGKRLSRACPSYESRKHCDMLYARIGNPI